MLAPAYSSTALTFPKQKNMFGKPPVEKRNTNIADPILREHVRNN
jgi:hypothetical protein